MKEKKMKTAKWMLLSAFVILGMLPVLWLQQGCKGNYPPVASMLQPPFTPTPTPGPIFMSFDGISSLPSGWVSSIASGTFADPALLLSTGQNQESSCTTSCHSLLAGPIVFSAANQAANIEYSFPAGTAGTYLVGKTISLYYYMDALPSSASYGQIYVQSGAANGYNYKSVGFASMTAGVWTQASIPANQGGVDSTDIWKFGAQIGTGSGSGFNSVNFYVDNVAIQ